LDKRKYLSGRLREWMIFKNKYRHNLAVVIATKDRPDDLDLTLTSIAHQRYKPDEVIIVDGGERTIENVIKRFPGLAVKYIRSYPPSAVIQRKLGIKAVSDEATLVAIMDDDIELRSGSLETMMNFWEKAEEDIAGASFHMINHPQLFASRLKSSTLAARSGLYSQVKGIVLSSGFQTMVGSVNKNISVEWLGLGAVIWRKTVFDNFSFDDWFRGYSYLEDLDFSYRVGKQYRLMVVADAGYYHYSSEAGRLNNFSFGKMEVLNRVYFVKKYPELSLIRCYFALGVRILISLWRGFKDRQPKYLLRIFGNLIGIVRTFFMLQ